MHPLKHLLLSGTLVAVLLTACSTTKQADSPGVSYEKLAAGFGWSAEYSRGRKIIRELSSLSPAQASNLQVNGYHREEVAFLGIGPTGVGDLLTEGGFYLRVVDAPGFTSNLKGGSWREVLVKGVIGMVIPKNKIIILEVHDERLIQTD
jgi:hypothetical protein